jgi:hypothetical protein
LGCFCPLGSYAAIADGSAVDLSSFISLSSVKAAFASGNINSTSNASITSLKFNGSTTAPSAVGNYILSIVFTNGYGGAYNAYGALNILPQGSVIAAPTITQSSPITATSLGSYQATANGCPVDIVDFLSLAALRIPHPDSGAQGSTGNITYSETQGPPTNPGTYTVTIVKQYIGASGPANVTGTLTIVPKLSQSISQFSSVPTKIYKPGWSGNSFTFAPPTSSSGLPVALSVLSGPATLSGNTVTLTGTGQVVLEANQAGDSVYSAAAPVRVVFTAVAPAITLALLIQTFDGLPKSVSVETTPAGLAYSLTYAGSPSAPSAIGSYAIVATITDAAAPSGVTASGSLSIVNRVDGDPTVIPAWQLSIDQASKAVSAAPSPFACKYGDDLVFVIRFLAGGVPSLVTGISNIVITARQFSQGEILLRSSGFTYGIDAAGQPFYAVYLSATGTGLLESLEDGETLVSASLALLAQVSWKEANPYGVGPAVLTESSPHFPLTVTRNLA